MDLKAQIIDDSTELQSRIISALKDKGPLTSHQLCEVLDLEWIYFSNVLLDMVRDRLHPERPIVRSPGGKRGYLYHLPDQIVS